VVSSITSSAGVVTVDASLGDYFTIALAENVTGWTINNVPEAASIMLKITQSATPFSVAWPGAFRWAGGTAGAVSTAAGAVDVLAITTFDAGASWHATIAKDFAA
jgi:hypothetical protein